MSSPLPSDSAQVDREPTPEQIKRWRRYLADELAEGEVYAELARKRTGVERDILLGLAEAEQRHAQHWRNLLGEHAEEPASPSIRRGFLRFMARHFGSIFVLALMQRYESDTPYARDSDATDTMAADEAIHEEIVRGLAARGREQFAGNFRAAVFGMNDGLVSNLALVMGVAAAGVSGQVILFTGIAGLLAGALSMGAGEFVSVSSQRELLKASSPTQVTLSAAQHLDIQENELELVYRARGMSEEDARHRALERLGYLDCDCNPSLSARPDGSQGPVDLSKEHEAIGNSWGVAVSSFLFFSAGAIIPVLPFIFTTGVTAMIWSVALVSLSLIITGGIVGLLSGASPFKRAMRQLGIGLGAAFVTIVLGLFFDIG